MNQDPELITLHHLINLYLLQTPRGPVLVDSALPGMYLWIAARLRRRGVFPRDLAGIVLTHFHLDHAGTAALFNRDGVPVLAHRDEIPILAGEAPHPGYGGAGGKVLLAAERALFRRPVFSHLVPLEPDVPLLDSDWTVVSAPGHSPGSLALWNARSQSLLSGDTLITTFGRPRGPVPLYTADLRRARDSARRLLDLEPLRILPGHGPTVSATRFSKLRATLTPAAGDPCREAARR
ncbi:MAG: MBL fold metallo-hydrolase [Candidatus Schekmanbacteria bacterium]|nr:MBL fold metallo-hydrolase [Candidatus Schekmanbacteria bacterium]